MPVSGAISSTQTEHTRLRRNALSLSHIVTSTLASIAPAMSFFFGFAVIARGAGLAAPLTIFTAMVVILFLTNTIAQFSRFTPSTGSFVTFTGKAFGPFIGVAVSVFLTFGYIVAASTIVSVAGVWFSETLSTFLHWSILTGPSSPCLSLLEQAGWSCVASVSPYSGPEFSSTSRPDFSCWEAS